MPTVREPHPQRDDIHGVVAEAEAGVGQHLLGPHVVGSRVVVRRLLRGRTGPSGGPAFTDVLGTCLSWAEGACVVQPEDGEPVRIAIGDIVSGKPVPPRPAVRHRVGPFEAQHRAMALFPDLTTEPLGDWVLRHSATSTARRANSVLAVGPAGPEAPDDLLDRVEAWYDARTRRPIAAVLSGSAEEELFRARGWVLESNDADTVFEIAGVAQVRRRLRGAAVPDDVEVVLDGDDRLAEAEVLVAGERVAEGVAAYADDWVGLRGLAVDPAHRRRGLGLLVVAELLDWGAERGATTAYLQVLGDNEPALRLYERLGFAEHHRYRYLARP